MSADKQAVNKAKVAEYESTWKRFEKPMMHPQLLMPWHFGYQDELCKALINWFDWEDWAHEHFDELAEKGHLIIAGVDSQALYDVTHMLDLDFDGEDMDGMEPQLVLEGYGCRYLILVDINDDELPVMLWEQNHTPVQLGAIDKFFKDLVPFDDEKYLREEGMDRFTISYE